ncbi:DUF3253 domain-containing protein [Actinomycetospora lutea]|uniref:DUF3253 domain-containing protein n=1 Tax=Actinomycetospora lutea TaxID=663604 RepID=UPI002366DCE4|nr:DUF3253 domain-containing protein [Actinomycetospora lutea]MDD7940150.1 DUF3253 domain-containing protein [Actinomycetospora lutea]
MPDTDRALRDAIVDLLDHRAAGKTICPSEAARRVDPDAWRDLMPEARRVARRLVDDGTIEMTQGGEVVDPAAARGPVRLRYPTGRGGSGVAAPPASNVGGSPT